MSSREKHTSVRLVAALEQRENELVSREAPRWAWELIYEILLMGNPEKMFTHPDLRRDAVTAHAALVRAYEHPGKPFSRKQIEAWLAIHDNNDSTGKD